MGPLFFYGTLCHIPVLSTVLGRSLTDADLRPAVLPDHAAYWVGGQSYPMIVPQPGAAAQGLFVDGLGPDDIARLDFYEGGHDYALRWVEVTTDRGPQRAQVYFADHGDAAGAPWVLDDWVAQWGALTVLAAQDAMGWYGQVPAEKIEARFPSIRSRAAARLNAGTPTPTTLRRRADPADVNLIARTTPYAGFFAVEDYDLTHRRFDGTMSEPLSRAAFISADAATVLPYDPQRDRVMLIEQFRMGPYARGDAQCWSLEAIAGRLDPGETPEAAVRREAREEAGLELGALHPVHQYYPSPGAQAEYIYSYVGLADLGDDVAGLGGVAGEGEDIRSHVIPFDRLSVLLNSGELENGPLLISVLWLTLHRAQLRSKS